SSAAPLKLFSSATRRKVFNTSRETISANDCSRIEFSQTPECYFVSRSLTTTMQGMKAATYTAKGPAAEVLRVQDIAQPEPQAGEVLVCVAYSGVNRSDVKGRAGVGGAPMDFPLVVPHSDGAGRIAAVGAGVPAERVGQRVWLFNSQWRRPFGTAAEYVSL